MIIHGQVELTCAFGRIGCLQNELFAGEPYRDVEFPSGARWYQGAEWMRLKGVTMEKSGCQHRGKPAWVIELPPDWEVIALWEGEGFYHGELWADYGDHRDLSGLFLNMQEEGFEDEQMDWWDEWFDQSHDLLGDTKLLDGVGRIESWESGWWDTMVELHRVASALKRGTVYVRDNGHVSGQMTITRALRAEMVGWKEKVLRKWDREPFAAVPLRDWARMCGWCLHPLGVGYETAGGLLLCRTCGEEYFHEEAVLYQEAERISVLAGRPFHGIVERQNTSDPW